MNYSTAIKLYLLISFATAFKFSNRIMAKSDLILKDANINHSEKDFLSVFKLSRVCRVCKKQYNQQLESNDTSCRYHKGRWLGAENSKHMGTRSGGRHIGLSLFWDCCDEECESGPGCCFGPHKSYDD